MKKIVFMIGAVIVFLTGVLILSIHVDFRHEEEDNQEMTQKVEFVEVIDGKIRIDEVYTTLGVPSDSVYVTREVLGEKTVVSVFDKESQTYLFGFEEEGTNPNARGAYTKTVSKITSSNGAEAKVQMVLECYQDSNHRQINKIKSTKWIAVSGSILECEYTSYISDKNDQGVGTKARMFGTVKMKKGSDSNIWTSIDHTYSLD